MKTKFNLIVALVSVAALSGAGIAHADDDDLQEMAVLSKEFGLISVDEARKKALEAKPGVVEEIDLDSRKFGKGFDYEVEIIDADGAEWEVYIDAKTGEVRKTTKEWF